MAEHIRNQLAREGFVFSPAAVSTFSKFVNDFIRDTPAADSATLQIIAGKLLHSVPLTRYMAVRDYPGFRTALVRAIEECSGAGADSRALTAAGAEPDFVRLFEAMLAEVEARGLHIRSARLAQAAERITAGEHAGELLVCGFFAFTPPEIELLRALSLRSDLVVTLPESPASAPAIEALRSFASEVKRLEGPAMPCERVLVPAASLDAEAVEIARRILEEHASGRPFREIGVVVRSEGSSVPALRTAFDRFGIPARFYFAPALASDPTVTFLTGLIDAALEGWEHEATLAALRMYGSPLERTWSGDGFDREVRLHLPGHGLDTLRNCAPEWSFAYFEELAKLEASLKKDAIPFIWADRFTQASTLFRPAVSDSRVPHDRALVWRAQAAAIEQFQECAAATAEALDPVRRIPAREFREALQTTLAAATLHVVDRRRDVVHLIDAIEARQWRLPIVFAAGLLEGEFPLHHSEDPILPDGVRKRLKGAGVPVRTAEDQQAGEQFLFDMVLTRATERLCLSYAQLNAKGEPNLPSFLLERARPFVSEEARAVRRGALYARAPEPVAAIISQHARAALLSRHARLSASGIEKYIQCPFGFFLERTLDLNEPPDGPWERFNMKVQGNIAHRTFELHYRDGIPVAEAFAAAFAENCAEEGIPDGYRTEAVRLELLHAIEQFVRESRLPRGTVSRFEEKFEFAMPGGPVVHGRIDRIEADAHGNALIVDYKYRTSSRIKETVSHQEDGKAAQAGLYLMAARELGYNPIGMVFCGFKGSVSAGGWVQAPFFPELGTASSQAQMDELAVRSGALAIQMASDLANGRIAVEPEDDKRCFRCSYLKICRSDVARAVRTATGVLA
jgi:ATP-dependent helicase/DNAse subunit B